MYYIKLTGGFRLNKTFELPDARFILHAAAAWAAAALILALLAALAVSQLSIPAGTIGYISSAMSFIAALIAGSRAARERKTGAVYTGLVAGVVITTLALTLGFIVAGDSIAADGVLSVVTFTLAGCLVGSVFFAGGRRKSAKSRAVRRKA